MQRAAFEFFRCCYFISYTFFISFFNFFFVYILKKPKSNNTNNNHDMIVKCRAICFYRHGLFIYGSLIVQSQTWHKMMLCVFFFVRRLVTHTHMWLNSLGTAHDIDIGSSKTTTQCIIKRARLRIINSYHLSWAKCLQHATK